MLKILVTGSKGFVGKNLIETLKTIREEKNKVLPLSSNIEIYEFDKANTKEKLKEYCAICDFVIHLAGVNRPQNPSEFYEGNVGFTEMLCSCLKDFDNQCPILISSSIQAERDNDYGKSKKEGENFLLAFSKENGNPVYIYRFANLFGKWCRPNYNSVVATWCYNIAHGLDIQISDPNAILTLCYIDDVVEEIIHCICGTPYIVDGIHYGVEKVYDCSLSDLAEKIKSFKESRKTLRIVDQQDELTKKLYATYLSYLPEDEFKYPLKMNVDERGSFTEFLKTKEFGQISINVCKPGTIKGNHWHHTKNEKFLVVSGSGLVQFRRIGNDKIFEYKVSGDILEVIDIPTGYTHNIINLGNTDMVTIMWASEIFDPNNPETYFEKVDEI